MRRVAQELAAQARHLLEAAFASDELDDLALEALDNPFDDCARRRVPCCAADLAVTAEEALDRRREAARVDGLPMKPSAPTARLVCRSPSAVIATMGTPLRPGVPRRRSVTS